MACSGAVLLHFSLLSVAPGMRRFSGARSNSFLEFSLPLGEANVSDLFLADYRALIFSPDNA